MLLKNIYLRNYLLKHCFINDLGLRTISTSFGILKTTHSNCNDNYIVSVSCNLVMVTAKDRLKNGLAYNDAS